MFPTIELFGRSIPTYWVCALIGFAVCGAVAVFRHRAFGDLAQVDVTNTAALIGIGIVAGGRLLYIVTMLPVIIRNREIFRQDPHLLYELLSNGLVFYGGLFGAILMLYLYSKHYKLDRKAFFDFFIPLFPLFHAFGRIGCFLTGCCHGVVSERFGIAFTRSASAPNGVPFFPIQLVCAVCDLILFAFLLWFEKRRHREGKALPCYLVVYAVGRFMIEFFRGDEIRGFILGLSTSQWISLLVLLVLAVLNLRALTKRRKALS
ncbi:MAG: prolipoprotein diacylglyceryl transferase [Clostridiales bacterium]|nr:prolipoprotein diacylglyceryl transferase [Clostridiales bacterium]